MSRATAIWKSTTRARLTLLVSARTVTWQSWRMRSPTRRHALRHEPSLAPAAFVDPDAQGATQRQPVAWIGPDRIPIAVATDKDKQTGMRPER